MCNDFVFYKVGKYNIKGKKHLSSNDKYCLSNHTSRYAKFTLKAWINSRTLESTVNIVLLRRGYKVYVGVLYKKKKLALMLLKETKKYMQISDNISDEKLLNESFLYYFKSNIPIPKW